ESAALERVNAFVGVYGLEPQELRQGRAGPSFGVGRDPAEDRADILRAIKALPRGLQSLFPFGVAHFRMMSDTMVQIVFVHVGVGPYPFFEKNLVVFRTRQRG